MGTEVLPRRAALRKWKRQWRPAEADAALYGASALFALLTIAFSGLSLYRQWAELAIGPYVAAALLSLALAWYRSSRRRAGAGADGPSSADRPSGAEPGTGEPGTGGGTDEPGGRAGGLLRHWGPARAWIFVGVLLGATLVPLGLEVEWRSQGNPTSHVQPEVVVVEQAGHRAAKGKDPYRVIVRHGHLVVSTPGEPEYENFFPYGPLMSVFGLPSSTKAPIRLTDARIFFSICTLAVALIALGLCRAPHEPRIRALEVITVLPTAALPLATGGDDMPVVAFLLLAMVLAQRRQPLASGLVLGVATAMKFTAWPLVALALFAARDRTGKRRPWLMALGMAVVVVPSVVPFLANNASAFLQNVVLYPLGLAGVASPAASPFPGHLLVSAFPALHKVVPLALAVVGGAVLVRYLVRHTPQTTTQVCNVAGWVMTVAILLAPATRVGYLLYPINFFVWGAMFRQAEAHAEALEGSRELVVAHAG